MTAQSSDDQLVPSAVSAGAENAEAAKAERHFNLLRKKTEDLVASGIWERHAHSVAQLEMLIAQWPSGWGDDLVVQIYGDFNAPQAELNFPDLGITIEPEKLTTSHIKALCVLKARVKISEKSVNALRDAAARINTLLGVQSVLDWGNSGCGWWSHLTHDLFMGGMMSKLEPDRVQRVVQVLGNLPQPVARKVRSALYWIREPRRIIMESPRIDVFRLFTGYWNAFECLVDAVCLLYPQHKLGRAEKKVAIDAFVAARHGKLNAAAISDCYKAFVDPGFVTKASHALNICFAERAEQYVRECFRMKPEKDRLFNIRNAINHGDVDVDDPSELLRVEDRHSRLWIIVFGMLGLIIPIDRPLDQP